MDVVLPNEDVSKAAPDYTPAYRRQGFLKEITQILETDFKGLGKKKSNV
jgi:hypothetical protein